MPLDCRCVMPYPMMRCQKHSPAPGYVVCGHVLNDKKPVGEIIPATEKEMGQILCGYPKCDDPHNAFPVCFQCCEDRGWLIGSTPRR